MRSPRPVITHLGLGDAIVQAPLMIALAQEERCEIAFPAYERYRASVESFFALHPLVKVYPLPDFEPGWEWGGAPDEVFSASIARAGLNGAPPVLLGFYKAGRDKFVQDLRRLNGDFSRVYYDQLALPYTLRFERCPLKAAARLVKQVEPVFPLRERKIFLHDDPERNFRITRLVPNGDVALRPKPEESHLSVLRYARAIREADEIHVIDSCFFWLVNALLGGERQLPKLYFHAYVRWPAQRWKYINRLPWQYLYS